jgi:serine protease Do
MRALPKLVSRTDVGKLVELEIWRNKKVIKKDLKLGRLESSADFKAETKKSKPKTKTKDTEIENLKIKVRNLTTDDIETRKLNKNIKGVLITYISNKSPVSGYLQVGDIILEVQKNKINSAKQFNSLIENIYKKGKKTILLAIINTNNQRRYLGVKTN